MRDFFYNKSDVLVAIVVILVAAVVIYIRVGIIMDYPSRAAGGEGRGLLPGVEDIFPGLSGDKQEPEAVAEVLPPAVDHSHTAPAPEPIQDAPVVEPAPEPLPVQPPEEVVTPPEPVQPEPVQPEAPAVTPSEISIVVVAGDVGSTIGDKLISAGAITDKAAFLAEVSAQGADTKLKQGTFKIPAGASMAEIVRILVG